MSSDSMAVRRVSIEHYEQRKAASLVDEANKQQPGPIVQGKKLSPQYVPYLFQQVVERVVPAYEQPGSDVVVDLGNERHDLHEPLIPPQIPHTLTPVMNRSNFVESEESKKYFQSSYVDVPVSGGGQFGAVSTTESQLSKSKLMDKAQNFILNYLGCPPDAQNVKTLIQLILINSRDNNPESYLNQLVPNIDQISPREAQSIREGFYAIIALTKNTAWFKVFAMVITKSSMQLLYSIFNLVHQGESNFATFKNWLCDNIINETDRENIGTEITKYEKNYYKGYCAKLDFRCKQKNTDSCLKHINKIYISSLENCDGNISAAKVKFIAEVKKILDSQDLSLENKSACLLYAFGLQHEGEQVDLTKEDNKFKKWVTDNFKLLAAPFKDELFAKIKELEFKFTSPTILVCNKAKFSINFTAVKASFLKGFISLSTIKIKGIYESSFYVDGALKVDLIDKFIKFSKDFASEILQEFPVQGNDDNIIKIAISLFYAFTLQDSGEESPDNKQKQFKFWLRDFCSLENAVVNEVGNALFENLAALRGLFPDFDSILTEATKDRLFFRPSIEDAPVVQVGVGVVVGDDVVVQVEIAAAANVVREVDVSISVLKNTTDSIKSSYLEYITKYGLNVTQCKKKFCNYIKEIVFNSENFNIEDKHYLLFYAFSIVRYPHNINTYDAREKFKIWLKDDIKLSDEQIAEVMKYPSPRMYQNSEVDFGFYYRGVQISFSPAITSINQSANKLIDTFLKQPYSSEIYLLHNKMFNLDLRGQHDVNYVDVNKNFAAAVLKIIEDNSLKCKREISVLLFYAFSLRDPGDLGERNKDKAFAFWLQDFCGLSKDKSEEIANAIYNPPKTTEGIFLIYAPKLIGVCENDGKKCFKSFKTAMLEETGPAKVKFIKDKIEVIKGKYVEFLKIHNINITECKQAFSTEMEKLFVGEYQALSPEDRNYLMFSAFIIFNYPTSLSEDKVRTYFEEWLKNNVKLNAATIQGIITPMPRIFTLSPSKDGFYYYGEQIHFDQVIKGIEIEFGKLCKGLSDKLKKSTRQEIYTFIRDQIWPVSRLKVPFTAPTGVNLSIKPVESLTDIERFQLNYAAMQDKYYTSLQNLGDIAQESIIRNKLDFESCFFNLDFMDLEVRKKIDELRLKSDLVRAANAIEAILLVSPDDLSGAYLNACQQQAFGNNNKKATDPAEIKVFTAYYAERLQLISDNLVAVKAIIHAKYPDVDLSNATAEQISWTFITGDRAEQCLPVIDSMAYVFKDSLAESVPLEISANSLLFMHKKLAIQRPFEISSRMLPFPAAPSDGVVQAHLIPPPIVGVV